MCIASWYFLSIFANEYQRKYLVSQEYTRRVLTDETSFSFEHGIGKVDNPFWEFSKIKEIHFQSQLLYLEWITKLHGGFFHDIDGVVRELLGRRLREIIPRGAKEK